MWFIITYTSLFEKEIYFGGITYSACISLKITLFCLVVRVHGNLFIQELKDILVILPSPQ
jgi:hypothetical protein